jgi:primosomal protein N' (replication factor Y)
MSSHEYLVEVIYPQPVSKAYHYLSKSPLQPGQRVLVRIRGSLTVGLVYKCEVFTLDKLSPNIKYKEIEEVLEDYPIYPESLFPFLESVASYYLTPLSLVIKAALPSGLFKVPTKRLSLTPYGRNLVLQREDLASLKILLDKGLSLREFLKRTSLSRNEIKKFESQGILNIKTEIPASRFSKERIVRVRKREGLTAELKEFFEETDELPYSLLVKKLTSRKLKGLIKQGYLEVYEIPKLRKINLMAEDIANHALTPLQERVVEGIWEKVQSFTFQPILLYGVTGSGKTLVYLELIKRVLAEGKKVLVLLPEIVLTSYMERQILRRFEGEVAVLHSALPPSQRLAEWMRILRGEARVVIGTRSAVFAPVENLGLIIVDEEHDPSYKEENFAPRYQARDVALMRGSLYGIPVLLGSGTPSIKSFYFAKKGKYHYFELLERPKTLLPEVQLVENRSFSLFAKEALAEIERTLKAEKSVFVFLNRRGYAPLVRCEDCHYVFTCPNCDLPLTYHLDDRALKCHHCFFEISSGILCPHCGSGYIKYLRAGTERVEEELKRHFPTFDIVRFDRDSAGSEKRLNELLERLYSPHPKIIVSTQMGVHGHNFPRVSLVVVLRGEEGLLIPTYKSAERAFQLIMQALGRAGRKDERGKVLLQTGFPEHYVIRYALALDYKGFFEEEIKRRKDFVYPPFVRLAVLKLSGVKEEKVVEVGEALWKELEKVRKERGLNCLVYPPAPAPLRKLRGLYRWHILIKSSRHEYLRELLSSGVLLSSRASARGLLGKNYGIKVELDLDPEDLM